jgi:hypothetical protein
MNRYLATGVRNLWQVPMEGFHIYVQEINAFPSVIVLFSYIYTFC